MKKVIDCLLLGIICSFWNVKVESFYPELFKSGDIDGDKVITEDEALSNPNKAFAIEWKIFWDKLPQDITEKGRITLAEFNDLSKPIKSGTELYL